MKKLFYFAGIVLLSTSLFFSACTDETTEDFPPSISFVSGAGYISDDATLTVNTEFKIKVLAESNATSGSNIQSIKVSRVSNNQVIYDTILSYNDETVPLEVTFISLSEPAVERIEFKATAKDGESASINLDITTEEFTGGEINSFQMKVLGSYASPTGSSFASINGNVYTLAEAFNNQAIIDFLYWWGASTSATIGAPDDPNANLVFTGVNGLPNWVQKNNTRFKTTVLTAAEFNAVAGAAACISNATGSDQTRIGSLAVNQVFAFKSATGKHGLIHVNNIVAGADGSITINVKVEK